MTAHKNETALLDAAYDAAYAAAVNASYEVLRFWPSPTNRSFDHTTELQIDDKAQGNGNFVTAADHMSGRTMRDVIGERALLRHCHFRSEESDPSIADSDAQGPWWNIDEIDGTNNFAHGNPNFGLSIAFHDQANVPQVGIIALPAEGLLAAVRHGQHAQLTGTQGDTFVNLKNHAKTLPTLPNDGKLVVAYDVGYTDRGAQIARYVEPIADKIGSLVSYNSSSFTNVQLALGRVDAFFSETPTIYDIGAAAALVEEIDGVVTDMDGNSIDWTATERSYLAARTPHIHDRMLQLLHAHQK